MTGRAREEQASGNSALGRFDLAKGDLDLRAMSRFAPASADLVAGCARKGVTATRIAERLTCEHTSMTQELDWSDDRSTISWRPMHSDLKTAVESIIGEPVIRLEPMMGGDLSSVTVIETAGGIVAVAKKSPLACIEAGMLRAISGADVPAPSVLGTADDLILMTKVDGTPGLHNHGWIDLAQVMNRLHASTNHPYGWENDYAFGSVAISNSRREDWPAFWGEQRLCCHLPHISRALGARVERLASNLSGMIPNAAAASLLHGDLWGGNVLLSRDRIAGLIDPACYYGDREVDVAMLTLFDAPPPMFFEALELSAGWRRRLAVYRLWPLLVHLRLFGKAYQPRIDQELLALGF